MSQSEGFPSNPESELIEFAAPGASNSTDVSPPSLLDTVLSSQSDPKLGYSNQLAQFLQSQNTGQAIEIWMGRQITPNRDSAENIAIALNRDVGLIDELINKQLNAIIHHPRFQKLEASWCGLKYLHNMMLREQGPVGAQVKIKLLDISWKEIEKDFESAFDLEQSSLFYKIYEEEFGQAGGEPFGLLIGDYEIKPPGTPGHHQDDFSILSSISEVCASAFCPFIANASPELFELADFGELEEVQDLSDVFRGPSAIRWKSLCQKEDARFLGLAMPKTLMRLPYANRPDPSLARELQRRGESPSKLNSFGFEEDVRGVDTSKYLWGGAAFAFGGVVIRSFCRTSWLTDIRGVQRNDDGGGVIQDLPIEYNATDAFGVSPKISTDVVITDETEKVLTDLGFIPLCSCYDTGYSAFYSAKSIQLPKKYDDPLASTNARISSMVYTMLCVSRFAHYLKKIGRSMVGRNADASDIESELSNWIADFVTPDPSASTETKVETGQWLR
ncbi:MAG: type VI secretion system contractile sheath large subunit [Planctomycetota bacterium]